MKQQCMWKFGMETWEMIVTTFIEFLESVSSLFCCASLSSLLISSSCLVCTSSCSSFASSSLPSSRFVFFFFPSLSLLLSLCCLLDLLSLSLSSLSFYFSFFFLFARPAPLHSSFSLCVSFLFLPFVLLPPIPSLSCLPSSLPVSLLSPPVSHLSFSSCYSPYPSSSSPSRSSSFLLLCFFVPSSCLPPSSFCLSLPFFFVVFSSSFSLLVQMSKARACVLCFLCSVAFIVSVQGWPHKRLSWSHISVLALSQVLGLNTKIIALANPVCCSDLKPFDAHSLSLVCLHVTQLPSIVFFGFRLLQSRHGCIWVGEATMRSWSALCPPGA